MVMTIYKHNGKYKAIYTDRHCKHKHKETNNIYKVQLKLKAFFLVKEWSHKILNSKLVLYNLYELCLPFS